MRFNSAFKGLNTRFSFRAVLLLSESKDTACAARVLTTVNMFPAKGEVSLVFDYTPQHKDVPLGG